MESQALGIRSGLSTTSSAQIGRWYLSERTKYFRPNGDPITLFLTADPNINTVGGIGVQWWAGWLAMAELTPSNADAAWVLSTVKPLINGAIDNSNIVDTYWRGQDKWKVIE